MINDQGQENAYLVILNVYGILKLGFMVEKYILP
jgi:hypothetical protein